MSKQCKLGEVYREKITGFQGVAIVISEWLNGCRRVTLQPQKLQENGQPIEAQTFDEPGIEGIKPTSKPGGPCTTPARAVDPR